MSTTTFNLRNPITDRVEDVQVPNQCPKCQGVVCLSAPNEAGNIELRCYPCRWEEEFVPFPRGGNKATLLFERVFTLQDQNDQGGTVEVVVDVRPLGVVVYLPKPPGEPGQMRAAVLVELMNGKLQAAAWDDKTDADADDPAVTHVLATVDQARSSSCRECGGPCQLDENEVSNHVDEDGNIDYDLDADHVAIPEEEL